jgi:hypothetical protein
MDPYAQRAAHSMKSVAAPSTAAARVLTTTVLAMIQSINPRAYKQSKDQRLDLVDELWETLSCVNCAKDIEEKKLYCGTFCSEFAGAVRYVRRAIADGRINDSDVQEGIGAKLLMLTGGGYPRLERALSKIERDAIFSRDNQTCQICSKAATQIDHIAGSSNDPTNLRAICRSCNIGAAFASAKSVNAADDPESFERISRLFEEFASRVAAKHNVRLCDDPSTWDNLQKSVLAHRRANFEDLLAAQDDGWEDIDGYVYHAMLKDD